MSGAAPARRGARRMADIPAETLAALNRGEEQTVTLVEMLAVDLAALGKACVPGLSTASIAALRLAKEEGITRRMVLGGELALRDLGLDGALALRESPSDLVRGWAAYAIGLADGVDLGERLALVRPLADDAHSGVREWAWMGVRARIAAEVSRSIDALGAWSRDASANVRRFASEATRPRGVWCAHIAELRRDPGPALALLEPMPQDASRYVQDSVANWLNDASKDQPGWVRDVCARWRRECASPHTERIVSRALRTLRKEGDTKPRRRG